MARNTNEMAEMAEMTVHWAKAQPIVTNYLRSVVISFHDVEDLVQQVAYAVASRYDEYDRSKPFTPWVLGIAKYKVLEYRRRIGKDRRIFGEAALDRIGLAYGSVSAAPPDDHYRALQACVTKLTKRARRVLDMRYVQELKPAGIAKQLGATPNAICLLLSRTRKALAHCIQQQLQQWGDAEANRD